MEKEINQIINNNNTIQDQIISDRVELCLQKINNISIPSIIFENISQENLDFELNDLKQFYQHFGEILNIVINGKKSIVLFKTFFSANICKIFLEKKDNYKDNMNNNFIVRWFNMNRDNNLLPPEVKEIFQQINDKNIMFLRHHINNVNNININNINNNNNNININNNNFNNNNINNNNNNINNNNINMGMAMNLNLQMKNLNLNEDISPINTITQNQTMFEINPNLQFLQNNLMLPVNNYPIQGIGIIPNFDNINQIQTQQRSGIDPLNMFINKNIANINHFNNINNNVNNNIGVLNNMNNNIGILNSINNISNNISNLNNINNINCINNLNNMIISQNNQRMNNIQFNPNPNNNNINNNNIIEEKNSGKFTCKYEILIENDSEFQIARRLIGSKGCNMKKIINQCKSSGDGEGVKLRLRGKGSGYKEGPENKESDEPLHLCISSKNAEDLQKACLLVDDLLKKIFEDYKEFCEIKNIVPIHTEIATRIENKNPVYKVK